MRLVRRRLVVLLYVRGIRPRGGGESGEELELCGDRFDVGAFGGQPALKGQRLVDAAELPERPATPPLRGEPLVERPVLLGVLDGVLERDQSGRRVPGL